MKVENIKIPRDHISWKRTTEQPCFGKIVSHRLGDSSSILLLPFSQVQDRYLSSRLGLVRSRLPKMQRRAKVPCKQLNSEAIRGATLCYMSPVIAGQCSIISAKCFWNVKEKDLQKSWNSICKKRDKCDKAISAIPNTAFYFCAISTKEKKKGCINDESEESEEEQQESGVPSTSSQQCVDGTPTRINKALWPAITYWIALTTPNGAPANPLVVYRALLECGVGVTANQVHFENGKECLAIKELYNLLKDHRNPYMQDLVTSSYRHNYREEFTSVLGMSPIHSQEVNDCGTENVARVTLINPSFQPSLTNALSKMVEAKLQIDKFGFHVASTTISTSACDEKHLSDRLTILVNDVTIAMQKLQYASYRGKVYKREERSRYTYSYKCEARSFVNSLATNEHFKSRLIRDMRKIIELLADPNCELFQPLVINYDLIEVNDGVCWSLRSRDFVDSPIEEWQIGKVSPRAFCAYDPAKEAEPKYFREILENSLSERELATFCEDFLKLLNYKRKQHKDKVPCLVGDSNSGKTSLFFPIQGLVHHGNIATVTKQRAFNKAMITPFTEVIFIDEADENVLDIADWKILTQGGYTAHDVKYQTAKAFINKCPMLVTAQRKLEFGSLHQAAMDRRLRTYYFKSLPNTKRKAAAWLRKNAMECVVWAAEKAKCRENEVGSEHDTESEEEQSVEEEEGTLKEKEKEAIRSLTLTDPLSEDESTVTPTEEEDPDDEDASSTSIDVVEVLKGALTRSHPESLSHRQVQKMLRDEEERRSVRETFYKQRQEKRRATLRGGEMSTQNADLLPTNPEEATPTPIVQHLQKHHETERAIQEERRREKARLAYEGTWLRSTEIELHENANALLSVSLDSEKRASLEAYRDLLQDKLKNHHRNIGLIGCTVALKERKRACVALGLLQARNQHLVRNVYEALPTTEELGESSVAGQERDGESDAGVESTPDSCFVRESDQEEEEERQIFLTPVPSSQRVSVQKGRGRKRKNLRTQSQTNNQVKITKFFSSQQ